MFHADERLTPFEKKIWLSSPTMHGPELEYIKDAYEKNWMSTVGENINEVERLACETVGGGVSMPWPWPPAPLPSIWP